MDGVERIMVLGIFAVIVSILAVAAWSVTKDDLVSVGAADGGASVVLGGPSTPPVGASMRGPDAAPLGAQATAEDLLAQFEARKAARQSARTRVLVRPQPKQPEKTHRTGIDTSKPVNPYSNGSSLVRASGVDGGRSSAHQVPDRELDRSSTAPLALKASEVAQPVSGRQPPGTRKVLVKKGDTLWALVSRGVAGDASMADKVAFTIQLNRGLNPDRLKEGQELLLPGAVAAKARPAVIVAESAKAPPGDRAASASATRLYTVIEGDSLSTIAQRLLGKQSRFQEIFELNKDRLVSAAQIHVGMTLRIPAQ